jgi:hypothetical protein
MNGLRGNRRMPDQALRDGLCERCGAADQARPTFQRVWKSPTHTPRRAHCCLARHTIRGQGRAFDVTHAAGTGTLLRPLHLGRRGSYA